MEPQIQEEIISGLSFRNLRVFGRVTPTDYQKTVGNFPQVLLRSLFGCLGILEDTKVEILRGCDGLIQRGEMLLVLGRPGSGCTTLLKTIAGETHGISIGKDSQLNYQGFDQKMIQSTYRGSVSYLAELDVHFPTLTIGETLVIAKRARTPAEVPLPIQKGRTAGLDEQEESVTSLGLSPALGTRVGNDFVPGVSGGERKRLSIAELLLAQTTLQCWDNSTRGLDSSNATKFIRTLRQNTKTRGNAAIVSLYQASEELYKMFDKVMVLHEGQQIYFGKTESAKGYMENRGFRCPSRVTTPDFLTSLTNSTSWERNLTYGLPLPKTAKDLAQIWKKSPEYQYLTEEIRRYNNENPKTKSSVKKAITSYAPYYVSIRSQLSICISRGLLRLKNDIAPPVSGIIGNCVLAVILGSVFFDLAEDTDSFFGRSALIFFTTLLNAFVSGFEPGMLWEQRPIVEKHRRYAFLRPFVDAIAAMICDLPNKILTSIFFNVPVYFLSNLRRTPQAFLVFWLFSFTCLLTMSMIFRTIGSMSSTLAGSMAPVAVFMLMLMMYTGFTLPTPSMHPWFRWFNYLNPVGYTFESLMINEFHNRTFQCSQFVPSGSGYLNVSLSNSICNVVGASAGRQAIDGDDYINITYGYNASHIWRNFGILIVITVFGCATHLIAAEYSSMGKGKGEVLVFRKKSNRRPSGKVDEEGIPSDIAKNPSPQLSAAVSQLETSTEKSRCVTDSVWQPTLPFLLWDNLSFKIKSADNSPGLLQGLEGWVSPGTVTALMGVSGAGKTTLLNVLANRTYTGVITGDVLVDPCSSSSTFARNLAYAQQQDVHLPSSTVREALAFSALLRQPSHYSRDEKLDYVEEVIGLLDMSCFADAVIGVPGEGLNAEQRKRLTIGLEIAARPESLLFLDEPTSGLDSDTAMAICALLRRLAKSGQAILCTVHQPSALMFQNFDRLLFLGPGGRSLYFGEIAESGQAVIDYFEAHGARQCDPTENPAEWIMEITSQSGQEETTIDWEATWQKSENRRQAKRTTAKLRGKLSLLRLDGPHRYEQHFSRQLYWVTIRLFKHYWRTPSYIHSKALLCTLTALFISFSFWMSVNSVQGLQNQIFAIFLLLTIFTNLDQQIISQYLGNRTIFETREAPSRIYSWPVFVLSNLLVEMAWQTLMSVVIFACWYYPVGMFRNGGHEDMAERGGLALLTIWSFMLFTSTSSIAIVAGMESGPTAVNIAQLLYSLSLIFCGVLVPPHSLPSFWKFMNFVTPVTYFSSSLMTASLGKVAIRCSPSETLKFPTAGRLTCGEYMQSYINSRGGYLVDAASASECGFCPYSDIDAVYKNMGIRYQDRWRDLGITLAYSTFNVALAMLLYWRFRSHNKTQIKHRTE